MENFTYWYFQLDQFTQLCVVSGVGVLIGLAMTLAFAAIKSAITGVVSLFHNWPGQARTPAKEERLPIPVNVRPDARKCCSSASACGLCLNPLYDCRTDNECDHMLEAIREGDEAKHLAHLKETFDAISKLRPEHVAGEQYAAFNELLAKLLLTLDGMAECNNTVVLALSKILSTPQRMPFVNDIVQDLGRVKKLMTELFVTMGIPLPAEAQEKPPEKKAEVQVIKTTDPQKIEDLLKQMSTGETKTLVERDMSMHDATAREQKMAAVVQPAVTQEQLDATARFIEQQAAAARKVVAVVGNADTKEK